MHVLRFLVVEVEATWKKWRREVCFYERASAAVMEQMHQWEAPAVSWW
jgi:hypothetical protein